MTGTAGRRGARDLGPTDLVWDFFSRPRTEPLVVRARAAAAAGFAAIGVSVTAWGAIRDDPAEVEALEEALDETGVVIANVETLRGWADPAGPNDRCAEHETLAFELADRFACRQVQAIGDYTGTIAEAAQGFGLLCDRAADHGLVVGLEWVPEMTNIGDAATAVEIVEGADRPNGGYCFDSWHLTRSTNDLADLSALDPARIFATQFNDGPLQPDNPDYFVDTTSNRLLPGEGSFALVDMIQTLDRLGSVAPIGVEVISTRWAEASAHDTAVASAAAMHTILDQARSPARQQG